MFDQIFIEEEIQSHPKALEILSELKRDDAMTINRYDDIWGKVKKPYLHKRTNLNLFIAKKRGQLVKEAPAAYGTDTGKHFYFIHSYNCIYECEYCYLQGYFHTPDMVFFINHDEIIEQMEAIVKENPNEEIWFHAGEFSDSLALGHITNEFEIYWDFFKRYPQAKLELRTKSVNIRCIEELEALDNVIISFSMASQEHGKAIDRKTPSPKARIKAMTKLSDKGFKLGLHFDPIVYDEKIMDEYQEIFELLAKNIRMDLVQYISLGVVRFTGDVYRQMTKNYPNSIINGGEFTKSFDGKVRYTRPMRSWILSKMKNQLVEEGFPKDIIYFCMED